jgi:hypothetical protein
MGTISFMNSRPTLSKVLLVVDDRSGTVSASSAVRRYRLVRVVLAGCGDTRVVAPQRRV